MIKLVEKPKKVSLSVEEKKKLIKARRRFEYTQIYLESIRNPAASRNEWKSIAQIPGIN